MECEEYGPWGASATTDVTTQVDLPDIETSSSEGDNTGLFKARWCITFGKRLSCRLLDNINGRLKEKLDVTLWKNSAVVIEWFRFVEMKESCMFTNFDIVEFPTISEDLLNRAISFAKEHITITNEEVDIQSNLKTVNFLDT